MPLLVDFDGLEAKPTPTRARARSAVPLHPGQVAGINRNRWPISAGLGGRFPPDQVADFDRNAQHPGVGRSPQPDHPAAIGTGSPLSTLQVCLELGCFRLSHLYDLLYAEATRGGSLPPAKAKRTARKCL